MRHPHDLTPEEEKEYTVKLKKMSNFGLLSECIDLNEESADIRITALSELLKRLTKRVEELENK